MLQINFTPFPVLETDRLLLRRVLASDAREIFTMRNDPVLTQYTWVTAYSLDDAIGHINRIDNSIWNNDVILWGIALKGEKQLAGTICYWNIESEKNKAELGYGLLHAYMKKGIMNEALQRVLQYGFDEMKLRMIEAYTHMNNQGSVNLLGRNGFVLHRDMEAKKAGKEDLKERLIFMLEA
jgi:ribosomal-protein-alanine N-acetyltransferase